MTIDGMPTATGVADIDALEHVAAALRAHNIEAIVVASGAEARETVLGLIPEGAEVHSGKSKTLEDVGLYRELVESGRYDAIRPRLMAMDRQTQAREMRKLVAAPDIMLGSVAAVTQDGLLVAASATGSQLGATPRVPVGSSSWSAARRSCPTCRPPCDASSEVVFPYEDAQVFERLGVHTVLEKVLLIYGEWMAGRTTVVLVREPVGV